MNQKDYPKFYRQDWQESHRHLTAEGYEYANGLIHTIMMDRSGKRREAARSELISFSLPLVHHWVTNEIKCTGEKFKKQEKKWARVKKDQLENDLYEKALALVQQTAQNIKKHGAIIEWSDFSQRVQSKIKHERKHASDAMNEEPDPEALSDRKARQITEDGPSERAMGHEAEERIARVLRTLSYREREIIKLSFGHGDNPYNFTLDEIGQIFKVTPDRIRQIQAKAISKLRQPSRSSELEGLVEGSTLPFAAYFTEVKKEKPTENRSPQDLLKAALRSLNFREREVIRLSYGLDGVEVHDLNKVGNIFKVPEKRINQIKESALRKIKNIAGRPLEDLLADIQVQEQGRGSRR